MSSHACCHIYRALRVLGTVPGRRARPGKAKLKFAGARNFRSREDRGTGQGSGGVKCAGIGQKMGGGEEREGEEREVAI